jgi:serine/threonine protein phosphatase PrpC
MIGEERSVIWRVLGCSVRGASHRRARLPNQDAIAWAQPTGGGSSAILSVADGHGAAASFRSATGSALAVQAAIGLLTEFLGEQASADSEQLLAAAVRRLPRELTARWRAAVAEHATQNPISPNGENSGKHVDGSIAYGSTILAAAVTGTSVLFLQLGDGDILIVSDNGEVRRPWPPDGRFLGGETLSLCSEDPWQHVRVDVQPLDREAHQLILLCTDGYANSFREDTGFLRAGRDILDIIRQEGIGRVECDLEQWLQEASDVGSGDDITAGILWQTPEDRGEDAG